MGMDPVGIILFLFGAIVGSFLNVCIYRLPLERSVVKPRSHCVHCKEMIPWYDNVPFFSYLILLGRCRYCKKPISFRYFLVELITGLSFFGLYKYFGMTPLLWPYIVMVCCFIVATFVDFEHRIIPDEVSIGGMKLGLLFSLFFPALHSEDFYLLDTGRLIMRIVVGIIILLVVYSYYFGNKDEEEQEEDEEGESISFYAKIFSLILFDFVVELVAPRLSGTDLKWIYPYCLSLDASIIGAVTSGGLIYLMGDLGKFLFKKEAMGGGDVKLLAMIGAFLGWKMGILAFFIAPFFGSIYGIIEKIRTKEPHIAYGPFLVLGAIICLFWGDLVITWYFEYLNRLQ